DLYDVVRECLTGLAPVVRDYRPDLVVLEGDTASVFTGSLVAFFERTRVAHVEAGLRSGDKWRPFPEEIFRRLTGVVADLHLAPTPEASANLLAEGVPESSIHVTGNTVVDAVRQIAARNRPIRNPALADAIAAGGRLVLVTAHRRESFGEPLREAFAALRELANGYPDVRIVYPVHPNPNVQRAAREILGHSARIALTEPLDYPDLLAALQRATLVLTDSGGIQEEAPSFGTPVLVMRDVTERPEGVRAGVAKLVGTDRARILQAAAEILDSDSDLRAERWPNPYGDGHASERIADIIVHELTGRARRTRDWDGGP
ncbi:MAG TPA: UDP-N-acetylglucosamine 2-epimerase (non-hydrolyzing), partial [Longimicrobiales bacterium]|nr:UDP-N-acetylglucosamine 2-epimerase (non-hydrolyzing) [Longimicrobiales bacterium]